MSEYFKKGQIVPRRLGFLKTLDRKAQHGLTFGGLVRVDGNTVTMLDEGPAIIVKNAGRRMNNGTYKRSVVLAQRITFDRNSSPKKTFIGTLFQSKVGAS